MATIQVRARPQVRHSYIALSYIVRSFATTSPRSSSSQFRRSDFAGQPFEGSYEPGQPTGGPLGDASIIGAPRFTPRSLKQHLDQFVVGQERPKKILSVAVYNHYQRILELDRRQGEEEQRLQQQLRQSRNETHPVEDEYPGHTQAISVYDDDASQTLGAQPIHDPSPLALEKSNVMLFGPSGVGKTLMAKTLARVLEVPFSMSDCTAFTQAGYIGEDTQVCVERLLAAANYDVSAAEHGIICLDEIDKVASVKTTHGRDIGGEGVQQALLKIIEGTTLHITAKQENTGSRPSTSTPTKSTVDPNTTGSPIFNGRFSASSSSASTPGSATSSSNTTATSNPPTSSKSDTYTVRTDEILFIFTGAFNGLSKLVLNRLAKGSIGFGSPIRASSPSNASDTLVSAEPGSEESKMFEKHLPFFTPQEPNQAVKYNPLDLVEPKDLQQYGMIPELIGRIPVSCALSALDEEALVRVLTEPRNSLLKQYEQLFQLSGIEMLFTSGALREVARSTLGMGTGARGLRTVVERLLGEAMFEAPGSSIKHILITEAVAQRKQAPNYWPRGQQHLFYAIFEAEEAEWEARKRAERGEDRVTGQKIEVGSFEEYREKSKAAGVM